LILISAIKKAPQMRGGDSLLDFCLAYRYGGAAILFLGRHRDTSVFVKCQLRFFGKLVPTEHLVSGVERDAPSVFVNVFYLRPLTDTWHRYRA
jgi:hypothetical protein